MRRNEYFNTFKGQCYLRRQRNVQSRLWIDVQQEPKSKKIKETDAILFQNSVLEELKRRNKRYFRSSVVLKIDFFVNHPTPPSVYALAKNYLDLLKTPLDTSHITRNRILYEDDRQVKLLIVNYRLGFGSGINIQINTLRNFIHDLDFFRRMQTGDFEEDGDDFDKYKLRNMMNDDENEQDDFSVEYLQHLEEMRDLYIKKHGTKAYSSYRNLIISDIQRRYLESNRLSINWLLNIFPSYYYQEKYRETGVEIFKELASIGRGFVKTLGIELPNAPLSEGDLKKFKEKIRNILENFKKNYPILFPLKCVLGITVLFLPPKKQGLDLDNLARYIVPFVNEIIKPPRHYVETIDHEDIKNDFLGIIQKLPNTPQHTILQYQIIEIPRRDSDPPEGYIRFLLNDPDEDVWLTLERLLEKGEEIVDR